MVKRGVLTIFFGLKNGIVYFTYCLATTTFRDFNTKLIQGLFNVLYTLAISAPKTQARNMCAWRSNHTELIDLDKETSAPKTQTRYSLLHLECHFFFLKFKSIIYFSRSLLSRSVKKRPRTLRLEIKIK